MHLGHINCFQSPPPVAHDKSGFEEYHPDPAAWVGGMMKICRDRAHGPPTMIHVPDGKRYKHVCPTCGQVSYLYPPPITYSILGFDI